MDVIRFPGDHFTEVVDLLAQALGKLDPQQGSRPADPPGARRWAIYSPMQTGVGVTVVSDGHDTFIQVSGHGHEADGRSQ